MRARRAMLSPRRTAILLVSLCALGSHEAHAQPRRATERFDDTFRKYTKRFFGPAVDWRMFKAQGMAESNLDPTAKSWVGARGVMQLMPSTYNHIASTNPDFGWIDKPDMNIAAGIAYDRHLWLRWEGDSIGLDIRDFVFASYNAGRRTLLNAQTSARRSALDPRRWSSIKTIAPTVKRWRQVETLDYVHRIDGFYGRLDDQGRVIVDSVSARGLRR